MLKKQEAWAMIQSNTRAHGRRATFCADYIQSSCLGRRPLKKLIEN